MSTYKDQSTIKIVSLESIELNTPTNQFGLLETEDEYLHQFQGTFMYCDLLVDGQLFVTENQFNEIMAIENLSINEICDSIIYINPISAKARAKFNSLNKVVKVFSIENIEDGDADEIFLFQLI